MSRDANPACTGNVEGDPTGKEGMGPDDRGLSRHPVLRLFVALVTVNAVLGIWALLAGDFGRTQGRVLGTSLFVTAAMIGVLVNVVPTRRRVMWPLPPVSAALLVVAFALYIVFVWVTGVSESWVKLATSGLILGVAGSLVGLLGLVPLRTEHRRLEQVDDVLIGLLAATVIYMMWSEGGGGEVLGRILGVEAVLVAAITLVIPVVSHYLPPEVPSPGEGAGATGARTSIRYCPACGAVLDHPVEPGVAALCDSCGLRFEVRVA